MRFREFGLLTEENQNFDPVLSDLKTFLSQEAAEASDLPDVKPEIQVDAVLQAMENMGHPGFSLDSLEEYFDDEDSGIKNIVDAISNQVVTLKTGMNRQAEPSEQPSVPPEQVVGKMAKRAAKRGQD